MASVLFKRGKWWIRIKGNKLPGKWSAHPALGCGTREEAIRYAKAAQRAIDVRGIPKESLSGWIEIWLKRREEAGLDWKKDRGRLFNHVLGVLGSLGLREITAARIAELVHALRFTRKLANRTVRNIYSTLAACLRDAEIAGKIERSPCILNEAQLGPVVDKNPEWRSNAVFARKEAEAIISSPKIPIDRRVVYGLSLLGGLRPGESAALRWRNYDAACEPLGKLTVALSYSTTYSRSKSTKTNAVRFVPVHPALAALLAEWREATTWGTEPDDLIVPLPSDVKRTSRTGERFRGWDYTGRRWRETDLPALGWRSRSVYDMRATFITLALEDGANPDIIEQRVTHAKSKRNAFTGYDRGERWAETCREVAKLRLTHYVHGMYMEKSSSGNGLRRRVSKGQGGETPLVAIQGEREVIPTEHDLSRAIMGTRHVPAALKLLAIGILVILAACGDNVQPPGAGPIGPGPLPPQMTPLTVTWSAGTSSSVGAVACGDTISHPCPWLHWTYTVAIDGDNLTLVWSARGGHDDNGFPAEHRNPLIESFEPLRDGALALQQVGDDAGLRLASTLEPTPSGWAGDVAWQLFSVAGTTVFHVDITPQ